MGKAKVTNQKKARAEKTTRDDYMRLNKITWRNQKLKEDGKIKQGFAWLAREKPKNGKRKNAASHQNLLVCCALADRRRTGWVRYFDTCDTPLMGVNSFRFVEFREKII